MARPTNLAKAQRTYEKIAGEIMDMQIRLEALQVECYGLYGLVVKKLMEKK